MKIFLCVALCVLAAVTLAAGCNQDQTTGTVNPLDPTQVLNNPASTPAQRKEALRIALDEVLRLKQQIAYDEEEALATKFKWLIGIFSFAALLCTAGLWFFPAFKTVEIKAIIFCGVMDCVLACLLKYVHSLDSIAVWISVALAVGGLIWLLTHMKKVHDELVQAGL